MSVISENPVYLYWQFGNIPFTGQGQNATFRSFAGEILAMDSPSLANANLSLCFYGSTCSKFGNIAGWDVSGVTNMIAVFKLTPYFNVDILKLECFKSANNG
jgi:hypothetical protein